MPLPLPDSNERELYLQSPEHDLAVRIFGMQFNNNAAGQTTHPPTSEQIAEIQRRARLSDDGLFPS